MATKTADISFGMSEAEVLKALTQVARELFGAQLDTADEICYGGVEGARKAGEEERRCQRVWEAFPERVRKSYVQQQRRNAADKLRAEADKIERGDAG